MIELKTEAEQKLEAVQKKFDNANEMDERCLNILDNMEDMSKKLEEIVKFQDCIGNFMVKFNQTYKDDK